VTSRASDAATCPECGAIQWGNALCEECRSHWVGGDPVVCGDNAAVDPRVSPFTGPQG